MRRWTDVDCSHIAAERDDIVSMVAETTSLRWRFPGGEASMLLWS